MRSRNSTVGIVVLGLVVGELLSIELFKRLGASFVLIPLALGAVYFGNWLFISLLILVVILMAREWENITGGTLEGIHTALIILTAGVSIIFSSNGAFDLALSTVIVGAFVSFACPRKNNGRSFWPVVGIVIVSLPAICLIWLRNSAEGLTIVIWLLLVLWATDSGGFFCGKLIGGRRLVPRISPGKTWSGCLGGTISGVLVGVAMAFFLVESSYIKVIFLSTVISLVGQGGDITISALKRYFGVKDMGNIIPGHGGVWDRLDSLAFSAVAVAFLGMCLGGTVPLWQ